MNPIVFLTIDNVLSTQAGIDHWMKVKNDIHDKHGSLFCPKAVEALDKVITQFSADVVITDDWRTFLSVADFRVMLKERNIKWNILDYTPELNKTRGEEIKKWMDKKGHPSQFVIISDDCSEDEELIFPSNCVETNGMVGINEKRLYRKAIAILKRVKHVKQKKSKSSKPNPVF